MNQIDTEWLRMSVGDDRTFLQVFSVVIEWDRSIRSIIPCSPSLVISWSAKRYCDREISFVWRGFPSPMIGAGIRIGFFRKELSIALLEWLQLRFAKGEGNE